jgi:hypothetical protein
MAKSNQDLFKIIIGGCALIMCLLFFIAPLTRNVFLELLSDGAAGGFTAFNTATGTNEANAFPVAFLLLISPVALAVLAFIKVSFKILCGVSGICSILHIIFAAASAGMISEEEKLTGFNWVIIAVYIGLCIFAIVGIKSEKSTS